MKLKCYIIDDDQCAVDLLQEHIKDNPALDLLGYEVNPIMGLNKIQLLKPDVLFVGIEMPDCNGFDLVKLITFPCKIVFVTAFNIYAVDAFEKDAADFLLKPFSPIRFTKCINKLISNFKYDPITPNEPKKEFVYIKGDGKGSYHRIRLEDIVYVEANDNHVIVNSLNGKLSSYLTLREMAAFLPPDLFLRVHKSFIVNKRHIVFVDVNQILLSDKSRIKIGGNYKKDFLNHVEAELLKTHR